MDIPETVLCLQLVPEVPCLGLGLGWRTAASPPSFREAVTDCSIRLLLSPRAITHRCDSIYYGPHCTEGYMDFPSKTGMDEFESGYLVIATYNLKDFSEAK